MAIPALPATFEVVLQLNLTDVERFAAAFDASAFYVPPIETLLEETARARHGHFNVIHRESALKADVYLSADDELHAWAFERRRRLPLDDLTIWLAPIEYVILRKLEYYQMSGSGRHLRDISLMLEINDSLADRFAIKDSVERLGLHNAWRAMESHRLEG